MRLRRPELHTLAGAYALDALPEGDRARFERHLVRCRACAREQRELREATARLALVFSAVLLAAAAAFGAIALTAEHTVGAARQGDHMIAEVLNAPDAVLATSRVEDGGAATIVMSHRDHALVFTTAGLPPLPADRRYQLGLMGPRGDRPAGLLPAPHEGMTSPVIATGLAVGDWVGLTVEPAAGSAHPTTKPILMLSLTA